MRTPLIEALEPRSLLSGTVELLADLSDQGQGIADPGTAVLFEAVRVTRAAKLVNVVGRWTGTAKMQGEKVKFTLNITFEGKKGKLEGTITSQDVNTTFKGSINTKRHVEFSFSGRDDVGKFSATCSGQVSKDGKTMSGAFTHVQKRHETEGTFSLKRA